MDVRVTLCGCETSRGLIDAPVDDPSRMAVGLAEEVLSYWRSRADTLARLAEFRETCEREAANARSQGIEATFLALWSPELDSLRGPRRCTEVYFDLIHDSLLPQRWRRTLWDTAEVTKFFRAMRPYLRALAERRNELAASGATGAIDRVAVAAIRQAGLDPLEVISDMARDIVSRRIAVGGTDVLLYWRFKTIRGEIDVAPGVRWEFGKVRFVIDQKDALRRLRDNALEAMVSSPLLPGHAVVRCRHYGHQATILEVDPECDLFHVDHGLAAWVTADAAGGCAKTETEAVVEASRTRPVRAPADVDPVLDRGSPK